MNTMIKPYADVSEICIIDDDLMSIMLTKEVVSQFYPELDIKIFEGAAHALPYLKTAVTNSLSLIFFDLHMPQMNGLDFLDAYENLNRSDILILLTSSINKEELQKAKEHSSIQHYLIKPILSEILYKIFYRN